MSLLNKKAVRDYLIAEVKRTRPGWRCSRVSPKVINELERRLMITAQKMIHAHPSRGHTLVDML